MNLEDEKINHIKEFALGFFGISLLGSFLSILLYLSNFKILIGKVVTTEGQSIYSLNDGFLLLPWAYLQEATIGFSSILFLIIIIAVYFATKKRFMVLGIVALPITYLIWFVIYIRHSYVAR